MYFLICFLAYFSNLYSGEYLTPQKRFEPNEAVKTWWFDLPPRALISIWIRYTEDTELFDKGRWIGTGCVQFGKICFLAYFSNLYSGEYLTPQKRFEPNEAVKTSLWEKCIKDVGQSKPAAKSQKFTFFLLYVASTWKLQALTQFCEQRCTYWAL